MLGQHLVEGVAGVKIANVFIVSVAAIGAAVVAFKAIEPDPQPADQVGYYRAEGGSGAPSSRVMAYQAKLLMRDDDACAFLSDRRHSDGKLTVAVLYSPSASVPGHLLTTAREWDDAMGLIVEGGRFDHWSHRAMIYPSGEVACDTG